MAKIRIKSFEIPTQVAFKCEDTENEWTGGIGYGEEIICGCCGSTFPIDEIYEDNGDIYVFKNWVSIEGEIIGGINVDEEVENG